MLLTFVVPVYNVEKYIRECLESIYSQGLSTNTFEVLCIDDCGKDDSVKLIEEYISSNKICNCNIIHHPQNKGLSGARNTGAQYAKGQYIMFVDSDDYLFPKSIQKIWNYLESKQYDIIEVNCHEKIESKKEVYLSSMNNLSNLICENGDEYLAKKLEMNEYYPMAVTKIVQKDVFIKCGGFKEGIWFEDEEYTPRLYLSAAKCITVDVPIYLYRRRDGSITTTAFEKEKWIQSYYCVITSLLALCDKHVNAMSKKKIYDRACEMIISLIKNCAYYNVDSSLFLKAVSVVREKKLYRYPLKSKNIVIKIQGYFLTKPQAFYTVCKILYSHKRKDSK